MELKLCTIESGKIIHRCFRPADELEAAIRLQKHLGRAKLAIVIISHGMSVSTGIVNGNNVTHFNFRQAALNGKFVVILTQTTGYVIDMIENV